MRVAFSPWAFETSPKRRRQRAMKCQHIGCECETAPVKKNDRVFCSEHCADADANGHRATGCGCGHSGCRATGPKG